MTTEHLALGGLLWSHAWLDHYGALPENAVLVAFDWPSHRIHSFEPSDSEEKWRRSLIAGYHLALLLTALPEEARVCLLGQSYGGTVVTTTCHLLAGGTIAARRKGPVGAIEDRRPDLRVRVISVAAAFCRHWLVPGRSSGGHSRGVRRISTTSNSRDRVLRFRTFFP
ncbi:hypothetical protein [Planctomycetes bacterium Pan216]|uniref:hypothetical protein n=1 Tax=Kolteria novifilia TaxID=2527975 RepID=UPI0011A561E5